MFRTCLLVLVLAGPAQAQDTISLKEIRPRARFALDRADNVGAEAAALAQHLPALMEALTFHIEDLPVETKDPAIDQTDKPAEPTPPLPTDGLLYAEDFEDLELGRRMRGHKAANGVRWTTGFRTIVVSPDPDNPENQALRFDYPGEPDLAQMSTREQRLVLGPPGRTDIDELWMQYMVRVPDNWYHRDSGSSDNNKFLALWAESYHESEISAYFILEAGWGAHGDFADLWIASAAGDEERDPRRNMTVRGRLFYAGNRGEWIRIRVHIKVGNPGAVDVWRDNEKIGELPADYVTAENEGLDYLRHLYFFGWSNSGFTEDTNFYLDDLYIWTADPGWF